MKIETMNRDKCALAVAILLVGCQAAIPEYFKIDTIEESSDADESEDETHTSSESGVTEYYIGFTTAEGFTSSELADINAVAATYQFFLSYETGTGIGLYPHPEDDEANTDNQVYINPNGTSSDVKGRIDFLLPVRNLTLDIMYFAGESITLTAVDESDNVLATVQGTDGDTLTITQQQAGVNNPIHLLRLTGNGGGVALNIDNLHYWTIEQ